MTLWVIWDQFWLLFLGFLAPVSFIFLLLSSLGFYLFAGHSVQLVLCHLVLPDLVIPSGDLSLVFLSPGVLHLLTGLFKGHRQVTLVSIDHRLP